MPNKSVKADYRRVPRDDPNLRRGSRLPAALGGKVKPLSPPPAAARDENAIQMLGAWIAENGLHCSLKIGMWHESGRKESPSWGILLADVIRHIANAMAEREGLDQDETIARITESLERELDEPTSRASGTFHHGHS